MPQVLVRKLGAKKILEDSSRPMEEENIRTYPPQPPSFSPSPPPPSLPHPPLPITNAPPPPTLQVELTMNFINSKNKKEMVRAARKVGPASFMHSSN